MAIFIGCVSCSNDPDIIQDNKDFNNSVLSIEYLNITYNGVTYLNVPTTYNDHGDFIFHDEDFATIYTTELANDPDWSISIIDAENIIFYGNLKTNLKANGIEIDPDIQFINGIRSGSPETRAGYEDLAEVTLFDDRDYKDRNYSFQLNDSVISVEVNNLNDKPWRFNDKCSSLIITNNMPNDPNQKFKLGYFTYPCSEIVAVFIGYDDKNFSDRTITCVCPPSDVKKYPSLPGFNDKMSSFKFFFAQKGQYSSTI